MEREHMRGIAERWQGELHKLARTGTYQLERVGIVRLKVPKEDSGRLVLTNGEE